MPRLGPQFHASFRLLLGLWALGLTACGAQPPRFSPPTDGDPGTRARQCKARIERVPTDAAAHACFREAMARLGQLPAARAFVARLPDPSAYVAHLDLLVDPAQALRTAQSCADRPRCALVEGRALWHLDRPDEAVEALRRARRGAPAIEAAAAHTLVEIDLAAQAPRAARLAVTRAHQLAPASADAHFARARLALAADAHAAAEAAIEAGRAVRPDSHVADVLTAQLARQRRAPESAINALRAALAAAPGDHRARTTLARTLAEADRASAAVEHYDLVQAGRPWHPPTMLALGRALLDSGAPGRALAWAERTLEHAPELAEARLLKAEALLGIDRVEAALALRPALFSAPEAATYRLRFARALARRGHRGRAEAEFTAAVTAHPEAPALWRAYADWHAAAGRRARAAATLERGLRHLPQAAQLHLALGHLRIKLDDPKGAHEAFTLAARLAPDDPAPRDALAQLAFDAKQTEPALAQWEALVADHPTAWAPRLRLARAYRSVARPTAALRHAEVLTELRPRSADAWAIRAEATLLSGHKQAAIEALEKAIAFGADASRHLPLLATALADLGRDGEAEARFRQSLELHPENRALRLVFGHYLERRGRRGEAIAAYQQLLARDPTDAEAHKALAALGVTVAAPGRWPAAEGDAALQALAAKAPPASAGHAAVVLRDARYVTVDDQGVAQVRHVRSVLVQSVRGVARNREARVSFHASHPPQVVRARTLTPDGAQLEVPPEAQLIRDPHAGTPLYGDARTLVFQFAGVEPGAIIDYEVITARTHPDVTDAWWDGYILANIDPTVHVRYQLDLPAGVQVGLRAPGLPEPQVREADGRRVLRWDGHDIPVHDLGSPAVKDAPAVYASSLRTWADVDGWYHRLFADRSVPDAAVKARALALTEGLSTRRERIAAIYRHVEREIEYLGIEFGLGAYQPRPAASTLAAGKGDCKDMTALMVALLRAIDIEAYPALVRPGPQGPFIEAHPSPGQFSHVVLYVPGGKAAPDLWLDATAGLATLDAVPRVLRGRKALVVDGRGGGIRTIDPGQPADHRLVATSRYRLTRTGGGTLRSQTVLTGDLAGVVRRSLLPLDPQGRDALLSTPGYLLSRGLVPDAVEAEGLTDPTQPVRILAQREDLDLVGVRLDGALLLGVDLSFLGDGPVPALTSASQVGTPRVFERRVQIEPPPGYRFGWSPMRYDSGEGEARFVIEERRRRGETEIIVRLSLPGHRLGKAGRRQLLSALRGARSVLAPALRLTPGPRFDRPGFLQALVAERPRDPELRMHLGRALLAADRPEPAAAAFSAAREMGRGDREVLGLLALALMRADDAARAAEPLAALAARADAQPATHLMLAAALREAGRHDDATEALRRGLDQHPDDRRLSMELVRALNASGAPAAALAAAERHVARHTDDPDAHNLVADAASHAGERQRAEAAYRASLAQRPDQPRVLNNLAWLLRDTPAAHDEAITLIRRAIELDARSDTQWDTLAELLHRRGDTAGARRALARAAALNPARAAFYRQRREALTR